MKQRKLNSTTGAHWHSQCDKAENAEEKTEEEEVVQSLQFVICFALACATKVVPSSAKCVSFSFILFYRLCS